MQPYATIVLAAATALGVMTFARAEDPSAPSAEVAAPRFTIWTSGGCSRSLQSGPTFPEVRAALSAAQALQKSTGYVFVLKDGEGWGDAFIALQSLRGATPDGAKVRATTYARACRSGWRIVPKSSGTDADANPAAVRDMTVFDVIRERKTDK